MSSSMDALSGMVTKKGRFQTDPYDIFLNHGMSLTSFPTDAFSDIVTKKGRFGTDPYSIFLNHGTSETPSHTKFPRPTGEG